MATAYKKISELLPVDAATLTNDEPIPTVQAGATKAVTGNNILTEAGFRGSGASVVSFQSLIRTLLQGLKMARVSTTSFSVEAGVVGDSTFVQGMLLSSTYTKTTSAWALGTAAGGLDTGAIAASTWYAVYLIKRTDTEVVDVTFSTNATTPTLPPNYTIYRRIGWLLTDGSSQFVDFVQIGRQFYWKSKVVELNAVTPASTNRILKTVTLPINVEGLFIGFGVATTTATNVDVGWTALTDAAASSTNMVFFAFGSTPATAPGRTSFRVRVDGSRQIYYRCDATTGTTLYLLNQGWIDDLSA